MNWIKPKTITGSPAEGDVYLRRPYINEDFWFRIGMGEHILISAPRRVGKSSIMKDIEKNCPENCVALYHNIESDRTQKEFFKRIYSLLIELPSRKVKLFATIKEWIKSKKLEISSDGIRIESKELNYKEELLKLIEEFGKEEVTIILLLDEFPDVIQSITKTEGVEAAIDTLHTLRSIRHDTKFSKFKFVFAGSVGINHIVNELDRPKLINDLHLLHIGQLSRDEAHKLLDQLLAGASMQIGRNERDFLIGKISYLLPFYIQLMIETCDRILHSENRDELTESDINIAFRRMIYDSRHFEDWEIRLKRYRQTADSDYCISVLTHCAHAGQMHVQQAYNLSQTIKPVAGYKELLDNLLVKDGYLKEERGTYYFLSPLLQEWWKNRHPSHEIER